MMWVFGYGSLIWKADFPYEYKLIGCVKGYDRKFYQHSTDHRGTPQYPGRVVTLLPSDPNAEVWGVAYKIHPHNNETVIQHLDHREKNGYKRVNTLFYPRAIRCNPIEITTYIGSSENLNYAGEADEKSIAKEVVKSSGKSGTNIDYVYKLAGAMRKIAPHIEDNHLFGIEKELLKLEKKADETYIKM